MAEFTEVMRQAKRMCEAHGDTCLECPVDNGDTCAFMRSPWNLTEEEMAEVERIVMDWAAAHPEPRYPTWKEWQDANFPNSDSPIAPCAFASQEFLRCESNEITTCDECRAQPIPADIAEKLGIRPIGGSAE